MTKLKECPFCGGDAEVYGRTTNLPPVFAINNIMWVADCTVCDANIELNETGGRCYRSME